MKHQWVIFIAIIFAACAQGGGEVLPQQPGLLQCTGNSTGHRNREGFGAAVMV